MMRDADRTRLGRAELMMYRRLSPLLVSLASALVALALSPNAYAVVRAVHVDPNSGAAASTCGAAAAPCASLADAAARVTGGETIIVDTGVNPGATFDVPVTLTGPGVITGVLRIRAASVLDGVTFEGTSAGDGIRIEPIAAQALDGVAIRNSSLRAAPDGALVTIDHASHVAISDTALAGAQSNAAPLVDASRAVGLTLARVTARGAAALVQVRDTSGTGADPVQVTNATVVDGVDAVVVGAAVAGIDISGLVTRSLSGAALRVTDTIGDAGMLSRAVSLNACDVASTGAAVVVIGVSVSESPVVRGCRFYDLRRAASNDGAAGVRLDMRRNWWGSNAGMPSGAADGAVDASNPLQLRVVAQPQLLPHATGSVDAVLVGQLDGAAELQFAAVPARMTTTSNASLNVTDPSFAQGRAHALLTAGAALGVATTTVSLDDETTRADTQIVSVLTPVAAALTPGSAVSITPRVWVSTRMLGTRARYIRHGVRFRVTIMPYRKRFTLRSTVSINRVTARRIGLRACGAGSSTRCVIGSARLASLSHGMMFIGIRPSRAARIAMLRAHRPIMLTVTNVVTVAGTGSFTRTMRVVVPARAI